MLLLLLAVVGIDLGTTFSVVAVNEHGTIRVINDTDGDPLVPSVVSFQVGVRWLVLSSVIPSVLMYEEVPVGHGGRVGP